MTSQSYIIRIARQLLLTALMLCICGAPSRAGVLDGFEPNFNDWTGSVSFDDGAGLSGFIDYAVMTFSTFSANFSGLGHVPTLGELVYTYQLTNTGAIPISEAVIGITNQADNIGHFDIGDVNESSRSLNATNATWEFNTPSIASGQTSWGLAFSSFKAPIAGSMTINGAGTATVSGVPTPGPLDFNDTPEPISIDLDVRPGNDTNPINLRSKGVLPVAVISTDQFNAADIDVESLLIGDPVLLDAGATGVSPIRSNLEDVTADSLLDLSLFFSIPDLVDGGVLGPLSEQLRLTGSTLDNASILAVDEIRNIPMATIHTVPEPATWFLGLVVTLVFRRRRMQKEIRSRS